MTIALATVSGADSNWQIARLYIGGSGGGPYPPGGTGKLVAEDQGVVRVGSDLVLWQNGTVEVGPTGIVSVGSISPSIPGSVAVRTGGKLSGLGNIEGNVVVEGGTVSPGSSLGGLNLSGALTVNGNYTQAASGILRIDLASDLAPKSSFDRLVISGSATLGGTLQVLTAGLTLSAGQSFDILDWATRTGTFAALQLPALAGSLQWNTSQLYTAGILRVTVLGDYNANGIVDAADYTVWRDSLGEVVEPLSGADSNGNGFIDNADYQAWKRNYGRTLGIGASGAGTGYSDPAFIIPEPSTLLIGLLGIAAIMLVGPKSRLNRPVDHIVESGTRSRGCLG